MLIESLVLQYLKTKLDMSEIYTELPDTLPDRFAILTLMDRGKVNQVNAATIEIECYARKSKYEAATLDEAIRGAMEEIGDTEDVSCRFGGGDDNPDTALKMYRYRSYHNLYF